MIVIRKGVIVEDDSVFPWILLGIAGLLVLTLAIVLIDWSAI